MAMELRVISLHNITQEKAKSFCCRVFLECIYLFGRSYMLTLSDIPLMLQPQLWLIRVVQHY